jgi:hypothetical protein
VYGHSAPLAKPLSTFGAILLSGPCESRRGR